MTLYRSVIARTKAKSLTNRLAARFAANGLTWTAGANGPGLVRIGDQLYDSTTTQSAGAVTVTNAGRPAAAVYAPTTATGTATSRTSTAAILGGSTPGTTGGVPTTRRIDTIWPLLGGGDLSADRALSIAAQALAKPYATIVVAAADSDAVLSDYADFVCDGTADDVTITAAIAQANGGAVVLLDGLYYLSGSITMTNVTKLYGMGYGSTRLIASTAAPVITKSSVLYRATIADLTIDGADLADGIAADMLACSIERVNFTAAANAGIAADVANGVTVTDCQFDRSPAGVSLGYAVGVNITASRFLSLSTAGVELRQPLRSTIHGCTFRQCGKGAILGEIPT